MELFIHKPVGVELKPELRKMLATKYGPGYMLYTFCQDNVWKAPIKKIAKTDMESNLEAYSADSDSLIYFNSTVANSYSRTNFFQEITDTHWSIYFPSFNISCIKEGFANSCKYKYDHQMDSAASMLYERFLKPVSNARRLDVMRFLLEKDGTESAWVCNGEVHLLTQNVYNIDGMFFSNLEHENDLPTDLVKSLSIALALLGFQKDPASDPKQLIDKFSKMPHREIRTCINDYGLEEFSKKLA